MERESSDTIRRVAVIGAGLMGHGIAQTFALVGLSVNLNDRDPEVLRSAPLRIERNLRLMEEMGRLERGGIPEILGRVNLEADLASALREVDFVCESVSEDLRLKQELFREMDAICPPHALLSTNSSSFFLSQVGALVKRQEKMIATHFLNPPHLVPLVEVMGEERTSEETLKSTLALMRRCKWVPVLLKKQVPGYIANRLLMALFREAIMLVQDGVTDAEGIDLAVKAGFGTRMPVMGLLEVADLAGLDLLERVLANLLPQISCQKVPPALLSEMVKRNKLGAKSGKGFYDWSRRSLEELMRERDRFLHQLRASLWDRAS